MINDVNVHQNKHHNNYHDNQNDHNKTTKKRRRIFVYQNLLISMLRLSGKKSMLIRKKKSVGDVAEMSATSP